MPSKSARSKAVSFALGAAYLLSLSSAFICGFTIYSLSIYYLYQWWGWGGALAALATPFPAFALPVIAWIKTGVFPGLLWLGWVAFWIGLFAWQMLGDDMRYR